MIIKIYIKKKKNDNTNKKNIIRKKKNNNDDNINNNHKILLMLCFTLCIIKLKGVSFIGKKKQIPFPICSLLYKLYQLYRYRYKLYHVCF